MSSILSSISGQFNRSWILGTFFPVALFVIVNWIFVLPSLPIQALTFKPLEGLDQQWQVVALGLLIIVLTGILYNLNVPLTRLYEGYTWMKSIPGKRRLNRYQAKYQGEQARWDGMRGLLR